MRLDARTWVMAIWFSIATSVAAQEAPSATSTASAPSTVSPAVPPATQPTSQPTTTQSVQEQKREAEIKKEQAEETARQAESKLQEIREEKAKVEREASRTFFSREVEAKSERLELDEVYEQRRKGLADLRKRYAEEQKIEAEKREALDARRQEARSGIALINRLSVEQRRQKVAELDSHSREYDQRAENLQSKAEVQQANVREHQKLHRDLAEAISNLEAEPASRQPDERITQYRALLEQAESLIDKQRLIVYAILDQAWAEREMASEYRQEAEALRAANRRFLVRHAYLLNIAGIVAAAIGVTLAINVLAWLVAGVSCFMASRLRPEAVEPGIKRVRTLVYFVRSIAKLLVWVFALVTILGEFGISPGHSAGALGVIGLVLAGMFQELVVDFVKGIDIAINGHYFVGDFIEVGGKAGHVLDIQVKYTVLRTPSGQILNLPNSQCIPSRRFPSGYVDNYVDFPLASEGDVERAQKALADVGRTLNSRIEAMKQEPEFMAVYRDDSKVLVRVRIRVLPTCDWVIKEHYLPMVKRRLESENIVLADEPTFFFINNIATFRSLFSRQLNERGIAQVVAEEARPTATRPDLPDPLAPEPLPDEESPDS